MKSVLFVLDYYIPHRWWVENVFENIIKRLEKKWYKIFVLTSKFDKSLKNHEQIWNVQIFRIWKDRKSFILKSVILGKKILKENNIDIIHWSTYGWAIPAAILGKKFKKKTILTVHEIFGKLWYEYKWKFVWYIYKLFEKLIFKFRYDIYHCVSENTKKELIQEYHIDEGKCLIVHNGVDYDFWDSTKVESREIFERRQKNNRWNNFVFLYFWHAGKSKWIDYLVQALPELVKLDNVKIVFNIIESKRTPIILDQVYSTPWDNIQVFTWVSKQELRTMVSSCDCVIAPSISEWFWSVHTETVAMWKILITSKTSAIPEVVSGKIRFIKPANPKEIVQAAKDVIDWNFENIPKKYFDWKDTVIEIEKLY